MAFLPVTVPAWNIFLYLISDFKYRHLRFGHFFDGISPKTGYRNTKSVTPTNLTQCFWKQLNTVSVMPYLASTPKIEWNKKTDTYFTIEYWLIFYLKPASKPHTFNSLRQCPMNIDHFCKEFVFGTFYGHCWISFKEQARPIKIKALVIQRG